MPRVHPAPDEELDAMAPVREALVLNALVNPREQVLVDGEADAFFHS